jgi:hypothetical protein
VAVAAIVTATSSAPPRPVTGDALADSLMDKVHSFARDGTCVRADASRWSCTVPDASGSGGAEYVVTVTHGNCWSAKIRRNYGENPPVEASGCLT